VELNKLYKFLVDNAGLKIEISGHTDNVGTEQYNVELSEKRARSVYNYLIDKGIDPKRLSYEGYGESDPIATNETEEGRAKNRRTEIKILGYQ
jgi:outer membrane protein OmpA-like peptidoglycan-associated protein